MDKKIKRYITVILAIILMGVSIPITKVEAASKHLIIINTKTNKLAYYVNNKLVKTFPVATGKSSTPTPTGKSKIVNKIKNRPYYSGGIPGGSPNNPLGDRWLGLQIRGTYGTTYGIHGNNNESSIGKHVSGGCIRMHNKDVRWLFDQVPNYSDVILKSTNQSFKQIAAEYGITVEESSTNSNNGWKTINGQKYYYNSKGQKVTNWQTIDGKRYYFGSDGVMRIQFKIIDSKTYYFGNDGVMRTGWQNINNNKYYFNSDGSAHKGWRDLDGKKYYFGEDGIMKTYIKYINDKIYYFGADGAMKTGWQTVNNDTYYFSSNGSAHKGWRELNGKKYYFNLYGVMVKGNQIINGNQYYFNEDGVMQTGK